MLKTGPFACPEEQTMAIELRWLASTSASALHAAEALSRGESLVDERLQASLEAPTERLVDEIEEAGLAPFDMVPLVAALAMGIENNRELVEVAITKLRGRSDSLADSVGRIAGRVADVEAAFRRTLPDVADQLILRGQPLRQQWDARGPGMLVHFGRLTDEMLIPKEAQVALVYPVLGGDGVAHLRYNSVRIESVLANPHGELPEVVRLAWLLCQLNLDVPIHSENVEPARLPQLARLATLPGVLAAAQYVELVQDAASLLPFALSAWRVVPPEDAAAVAELVEAWWRTYHESEIRVRIALSSLDRMLSDVEVAAV
jgi:hypothetical protein